jgi:hypothetical protein
VADRVPDRVHQSGRRAILGHLCPRWERGALARVPQVADRPSRPQRRSADAQEGRKAVIVRRVPCPGGARPFLGARRGNARRDQYGLVAAVIRRIVQADSPGHARQRTRGGHRLGRRAAPEDCADARAAERTSSTSMRSTGALAEASIATPTSTAMRWTELTVPEQLCTHRRKRAPTQSTPSLGLDCTCQ